MAESASELARTEVRECLLLLVASMKAGNGGAMVTHLERLDQLVGDAGNALDSRLAHFLGNRSYAKALHFLEGEGEVASGSCQPRDS